MVDRISRNQASMIEATTTPAKGQPELAKLQAAIDKAKAGGTHQMRSSIIYSPKSGRRESASSADTAPNAESIADKQGNTAPDDEAPADLPKGGFDSDRKARQYAKNHNYTDASDINEPETNANDYDLVEQLSDGVIAYRKKNAGQIQYLVRNEDNQAHFDQLKTAQEIRFSDDSTTRDRIESLQDAGSIDNESEGIWLDNPGLGGEPEGNMDTEAVKNGAVLGEYGDRIVYDGDDDRTHVIDAKVAPERFENAYRAVREPYLSNKPELASRDAVIDDSEIIDVSEQYQISSGQSYTPWDGMLRVETRNGEYLVHKGINPEVYNRAERRLNGSDDREDPAYLTAGLSDEQEDWLGKHDKQGYDVVEPGDSAPSESDISTAKESGWGVKVEGDTATYMTTDGQKHAVSGEYTPEIFDKLEKIGLSMEDSVPGLADLDVMEQETTEGGKTVGELYWQKLEKSFGDEPVDSKKGEYFRLLQAQGAFEGRFGVLPYNEVPTAGIESSQTVWADEKMSLRPAEAKGLLDRKAVMNRLSELEKDEDLSTALEEIRTKSVNSIRDKKSYADDLAEAMESDEYFEAMNRMDAAGKGDEAQRRFASDIRALEVLDKDRAHEISQALGTSAMFKQVDDVLQKGDVSEETKSLVASDYGSYAQKMFLISELGAKRGLDIYEQLKAGNPVKEIKLTDGERAHVENSIRINDALKGWISNDKGWNWLKDGFKSDHIQPLDNENRAFQSFLDQDDMNKSEQKGVTNALRKLNGSGALGALGGLVGISTGITELAGGRGAETAEERMGAARFLLIAGATLPDSIRAGSKAVEKVANVRGMDQILGLEGPTYSHGKRLSKEAVENWRRLGLAESGVVSKQIDKAMDKLPEVTRDWVKKSTRLMSDRIDGKGNWDGKTTKGQMAGNFLRTLGVAADGAGGVLDIVLGSKAMDRAQASGNEVGEAAAGLQMGSGSAFLASGLSGAAALMGIPGAQPAAILLSIAGLATGIVSVILDLVKNIEWSKDTEQEVRDYFEAMDDYGVAKENWGEKLNYTLQNYFAYRDDTGGPGWNGKLSNEEYEKLFPSDKPIWESQEDQYNLFTEKDKDDNGVEQQWWWNLDGDGDKEGEGQFDGWDVLEGPEDVLGHQDKEQKFNREFFKDNEDVLRFIRAWWSKWDGSDTTVSKEEDIDKYRSWSREEFPDEWTASEDDYDRAMEAFDFLREEHPDFFDHVDGIRDGGNTDGKIARKDWIEWWERVGEAF